jgi:hypothetical protein
MNVIEHHMQNDAMAVKGFFDNNMLSSAEDRGYIISYII